MTPVDSTGPGCRDVKVAVSLHQIHLGCRLGLAWLGLAWGFLGVMVKLSRYHHTWAGGIGYCMRWVEWVGKMVGGVPLAFHELKPSVSLHCHRLDSA